MLDKETLLKRQINSDSESEYYLTECLKRAKEITESKEELSESIERFLNSLAQEED